MKKIIIILFALSVISCISFKTIAGSDYTNYQEIVFDNSNAKLLKEFTQRDYDQYYKQISKRKFIGWRVYVVNANQRLDYVSDTRIKIFNSGSTSIDYDIKLETKEDTKTQLSVSGNIKISGSGSKAKFKGSVDAQIKAEVSVTKTESRKENYSFKISVDPNTYVSIITRGNGEVNNGVAAHYLGWIRTKTGGWESFTVMSEYYEIVKGRM